MDPPPYDDPYHSNVQNINKCTPSSPTSSSTAASASVLNNARNTRINNSTFSITTNTTHTTNFNTASGSSTAPPWDLLYKRVAPNAILNTGGRADEVRCHPGTREEVIGLVEKLVDARHQSGPRLLWLSGPAGAGKTAIMQTVAERCTERGVPHANFFFFRADGSRSNAAPLVATLIHQIIQIYPSARNAVAAALASNPLLLQMGLQQQFDTLMHLPCTTVDYSSTIQQPIVLLIDGLDECDSESKTEQGQILRALDNLLNHKGDSFRVVVASRVEPQLAMAFKQIRSQVASIFLDEQYSPEKDIRLFVTAEFDKIKATHYLAHTLGDNWPSLSDVNSIVAKSSGQFIYAATVMRFIAHSSSSPRLSLQKVHGIIPPTKNLPFAHLDAVYSYILSQVDDLDAVKSLLASKLLAVQLRTIKSCLEAYDPRYTTTVIKSCLAELTPLIHHEYCDDPLYVRYSFDQLLGYDDYFLDKRPFEGGRLQFFHASLADFLQDKSRAGQFYIDLDAFCTSIFPKVWTLPPIWPQHWKANIDSKTFAILALQRVQRPSPEITAILMNTNLSEFHDFEFRSKTKELVKDLHRLYTRHATDTQSFIKIMRIWTSGNAKVAEMFPQYLPAATTSQSPAQAISASVQVDPHPQTAPRAQNIPISTLTRRALIFDIAGSEPSYQPPWRLSRIVQPVGPRQRTPSKNGVVGLRE